MCWNDAIRPSSDGGTGFAGVHRCYFGVVAGLLVSVACFWNALRGLFTLRMGCLGGVSGFVVKFTASLHYVYTFILRMVLFINLLGWFM